MIRAPAGIVLVYVAGVEEVTTRVIVQDPGVPIVPAGIVPSLKLTEVALLVTVPVHCEAAGAEAMLSPAGKLSVRPTPLYGAADGFCKVMVRVLVPPAKNAPGENALETPMACTLRGAEAELELVTPCWAWMAFAGIVLV